MVWPDDYHGATIQRADPAWPRPFPDGWVIGGLSGLCVDSNDRVLILNRQNVLDGDLPTAAEYGANIIMVVMNNGSFGQTFMQQKSIYGHTFGTTFESPDFAQMARACGAEGIRVSDPKHVEDAMRTAVTVTKDRPVLLEMMVADYPYPKVSDDILQAAPAA